MGHERGNYMAWEVKKGEGWQEKEGKRSRRVLV